MILLRVFSTAVAVLFILTAVTLSLPLAKTQSNTFYNNTFTLTNDEGQGLCGYKANYVYQSSGSVIVGTITVKQGKIDLFILNEAEWAQWGKTKRGTTCAVLRPPQSELHQFGINSKYSFSYTVPDDSNHTFLYADAYTDDATVTVVLAWG